jgi:hypothetical protein
MPKLSQEIQDFILYISFNYATTKFKDDTESGNVENTYLEIITTKQIISKFPGLMFSEKFGKFELDKLSSKVYSINDSVRIHINYYNYKLLECFVYTQHKSINKIFCFDLVGSYDTKSVKFYSKKGKEIYLISPGEYSSKNPAQDFAIAMFYILNPELFSPKWELIAKKLIN